MTSPVMGLWPELHNWQWTPFYGVSLRHNPKSVDESQNSCSIIVPISTSYLERWCYSLKSPKLGKTVDSFPYQLPSNNSWYLQVRQQRGRFLFSSSKISLHSAIKLYGVFSNRVLPSRSVGQPRTMVTPWTVLRTSGAFPDSNFQGDGLHPALQF